MPKPGALLPSAGLEYALPSASGDPAPSHAAFRISVITAGSLRASYVDTPNNVVTLNYPLPGVYFEPGSFLYVWKTGASTLVTEPPGTVILLGG